MDNHNENIVIGLDIGTSQIKAVIGAPTPDGRLEILGVGTCESNGLSKGVVSNIEKTVSSLQQAIDDAEAMSEVSFNSVYAGIAGAHIDSKESRGIVVISTGIVTETDVNKILDAAKAVSISTEQRVLHVLPKQYTIDDQSGIIEPLGMAGVRLEVIAHIVISSITATKNIINCINRCGVEVNEVVLEQLASSYAVLTEADKESGVCLVDIGGGTTDIAVFYKGAIHHTSNIPIAGDHVTNDISYVFKVNKQQAEDIKIKYGCAVSDMVDPSEEITIPSLDEKTFRKLSRQSLAEVISSRYKELISMVQADLRISGFEHLVATGGVVLTGGCSKIEGAVEITEEIFNTPVKIGIPRNICGHTDNVKRPNYATSIGLIKYGIACQKTPKGNLTVQKQSLLKTFSKWLKNNF